MKIIGHRGARGLAPENTLKSIEHALKHHVDEVEIDLRVTKDNIVVLHHDASLQVAGKRLVIADTLYSSLLLHKPDLTDLQSALELIGSRATPLLEIKKSEPVEPIFSVLQKVQRSTTPIPTLTVASKDQRILRKVNKTMPDAQLVVIESWSGVRARLRARKLGTMRLSMRSTWLWTGFLRPMHKRGYQISPYTMNNPKKVSHWQPYLYGVITDYPDRFEEK